MKKILLFLLLILTFTLSKAQITWDGGGDGVSWSDANNWTGNNIPASTDDVMLDNSFVLGSYTINLPPVVTTISINTLVIAPAAGVIIQLIIPSTNTANPGLSVTGAGDALILNDRAILVNSTGVGSGGVGLSITNTFRINNGGKYVHNNVRGSASTVSQLSTAVGTETGVIEFDVPGTAGFTLSFSGRNYGTLIFSAAASAAARTYTGNGASDLTVRGDLIINTNARLSSTMTANIKIGGNLTMTGNFDNDPPAGGTGRSILFNGTANQIISGTGNFTLGSNFRNLEVIPGSSVTLQRGINLSNAANTFIVNAMAILQMGTNVINGNGTFQLLTGGWLGMGSADGITSAPTASGNVQTVTRAFSSGASYEYNGGIGVPQVTGDGLPAIITNTLRINNTAGTGTNGVTLSRNTTVDGEFVLTEGKLTTASPNNIFTLGPGANTTTAYSDNSFVNGPMIKYGNTFYKFPVGKGVTVHPIEVIINSAGTASDFYTAEYFNSQPSSCIGGSLGSGIDHISSLEYWNIKSDAVNSPTNFQVTLYATTYSNATDRDRLVITQCLSGTGNWANLGNANTGNTGAVGPVVSLVSIPGPYASTASFTFASLDALPTNPLPLNLIAFEATKLTSEKAFLSWELAAYCSPAARFEIQRADANTSFSALATMNGSGSSRFYTYTDNALKSGINYYRLKMMDEDGKITYSRTLAIINGVNGLLLTSLIPTIIADKAMLTIASSRRQKVRLVIIDIQGRIMQKQEHIISAGNTSIQLSMVNLGAGVYQLSGISADGRTNTVRFIRQ